MTSRSLSGRGLAAAAALVVCITGASSAQEEKRPPKPDLKRYSNFNGMDFVLVPAGEFVMGNDEGLADERPAHKVVLSSYYIQTTEVTNAQYRNFTKATGHAEPEGTGWSNAANRWKGGLKPWKEALFGEPEVPVTCVSWQDMRAFCRWLSRKDGRSYRLPTEAEWEKACRAGTTTRYYTGDKLTRDQANYRGNMKPGVRDQFQFIAPIKQFEPNPWGLYDMHGNVWEWCSDWYAEDYYAKSQAESPQGPKLGARKVLRGGSFDSWGPDCCQSAYRNRQDPSPGLPNTRYGFRVVMDAPKPRAARRTGEPEWLEVGDGLRIRKAHPRIFLTPEVLPEVAKRCGAGGRFRERYLKLKDRCDEIIAIKPKPYQGWIGVSAAKLGFVHLIEEELGRDGRPYARYIADSMWGTDAKGKGTPGEKEGWIAGLTTHNFYWHALAYDWIHDALTPAERRLYADALSEFILHASRGGKQLGIAGVGSWWYNQNWGPWGHGGHHLNRQGYSMRPTAALATFGETDKHVDYTRRFLLAMRKQLREVAVPCFNNSGAAWPEGYGHFTYACLVDIPFQFEAWLTATGTDLWKDVTPHGLTRELSTWEAYGRMPYHGGPVCQDDATGAPRAPNTYMVVAALLARRHRDGLGRALCDRYIESDGQIWPTLLWYDPTVKLYQPAKLPLAYHFPGSGEVHIRSRWEDPNATYVFFVAGPDYYQGWGMHGTGSFVITKQGPLAIRGGYGTNRLGSIADLSIGHNVVLIYDKDEAFRGRRKNDGGMRRGLGETIGGDQRRGRERGHVTAYEHNDRYTYVAADLTEGYANTKNFARVGRRTKSQKVEKVTRQMLYLRGEEELIVLFDRVLATKPEFPKTWVLNMMNEPETLLGGAPARASESTPGSVTFIGTADRFSTTSSQELKQQVLSKGLAKLACQTLLPKSPRITVRGGPGFTSWGNPHNPKAQFSHRDPSGEVSPVGNARRRSAGGLGCLDRWYRVEVEPAESSKYTEFLHVMKIAGIPDEAMKTVVVDEADKACWKRAGDLRRVESGEGDDCFGRSYLSGVSRADEVVARWSPSFPKAGSYEVLVKVGIEAGADMVSYNVKYSRGRSHDGIEVNQRLRGPRFYLYRASVTPDGWNSLGAYRFERGRSGSVELVGRKGQTYAIDAVKFVGTDLGRAVRMPKVELVADAPEGTRLLRIQATQGTYVITLPSTGETGGRLRLEPRSRKEEPYERPLAKTIQANAPGSVLSRRE